MNLLKLFLSELGEVMVLENPKVTRIDRETGDVEHVSIEFAVDMLTRGNCGMIAPRTDQIKAGLASELRHGRTLYTMENSYQIVMENE